MTAKQIDGLIGVLDRAVRVAERWADREYPVIDESEEATISSVGEVERPRNKEEYDALEVGRFEARITPKA